MKLIPYSLDILNQEYCRGWCYKRYQKNKPVTIRFYRGKNQVAEVICNQPRTDLRDLGLHPTGNCGFEVKFPQLSESQLQLPLSIKADNQIFSLTRLNPEKIPAVTRQQSQPVFFMHIPKTAGTTFNATVEPLFRETDVAIHIESRPEIKWHDLAEKQYVSGHLTLDKICALYGGHDLPRLVSIIRHPLPHLHSHFAWVKGLGVKKVQSLYDDHPECIRVLSDRFNQIDLNDQNLLHDVVNNLKGFELEFFDNLQTRYFLDYPVERVQQRDLERALENVEKFDLVGTTEQFPDFLTEFLKMSGINYQPERKRRNSSILKPLFDIEDPEVQKIIDPLIRFDLLLYQKIAG